MSIRTMVLDLKRYVNEWPVDVVGNLSVVGRSRQRLLCSAFRAWHRWWWSLRLLGDPSLVNSVFSIPAHSYSLRSAMTGFTRAARVAGINVATDATASTTSATIPPTSAMLGVVSGFVFVPELFSR